MIRTVSVLLTLVLGDVSTPILGKGRFALTESRPHRTSCDSLQGSFRLFCAKKKKKVHASSALGHPENRRKQGSPTKRLHQGSVCVWVGVGGGVGGCRVWGRLVQTVEQSQLLMVLLEVVGFVFFSPLYLLFFFYIGTV